MDVGVDPSAAGHKKYCNKNMSLERSMSMRFHWTRYEMLVYKKIISIIRDECGWVFIPGKTLLV